jgi:pyruvate formate lyase activating enzyme
MRIGGFTPFSLSDFPGRVSAVIFTQGCNFRCPYCHNGDLISTTPPAGNLVPESEIFEFIQSRRNRLDGIVMCGGEPTLQPDIEEFLEEISKFDLEIKLDTNGSLPHVVEKLLDKNLIDFVAMDIKAPLESYHRLAGVKVATDKITESIRMISERGIEHEFRTTVVEPLMSKSDVQSIGSIVPPGSPHKLQPFQPENAMDPALRG